MLKGEPACAARTLSTGTLYACLHAPPGPFSQVPRSAPRPARPVWSAGQNVCHATLSPPEGDSWRSSEGAPSLFLTVAMYLESGGSHPSTYCKLLACASSSSVDSPCEKLPKNSGGLSLSRACSWSLLATAFCRRSCVCNKVK